MEEKLAFVYEWENTINKMKYIGSHYGYLNDGYISSSNHFNPIYYETPLSFKRKILFTFCTRIEALKKEKKLLWELDAAKNPNYYNLCNEPGNGWSHHENVELSKIFYKKISDARKGKPAHNKGIPMNEDQKYKLSDSWIISGPNIENEIIIKNMSEFCRKNNLNPSAMSAVARGKVRHHYGYKCKKLTNIKNVKYDYNEWESKGKPGGVNYGSKNGWSKKVKIEEVIYDCMREASEKTGLSLHIIRKNGDFNV